MYSIVQPHLQPILDQVFLHRPYKKCDLSYAFYVKNASTKNVLKNPVVLTKLLEENNLHTFALNLPPFTGMSRFDTCAERERMPHLVFE
jgi:hypothetical protein